MLLKVSLQLALLCLICVAVNAVNYPSKTSHHEVASGSGEKSMSSKKAPQLKWRIPKVYPGKGLYMHDHPDFPAVNGGPGDRWPSHYLHAGFGIGHGKKRSIQLEEAMLKIFNMKLGSKNDRLQGD